MKNKGKLLLLIISILFAVVLMTTACSDNKNPSTDASASQSADTHNIEGVTFNDATFAYDGHVHSLTATGIPVGASISYSNNDQVNIGEYIVTLTVTKSGFNTLTKTAKLTIVSGHIAPDAEVTLEIVPPVYTGAQLTPEDFNIKYHGIATTFTIVGYGENVAVGSKTGYVDVEFTGAFSGTKRVYFDIRPKDINSVSGLNLDDITIPTQFYTGYEVRPEITLPILTANSDYTVAYSNNINYCMDYNANVVPTLTVYGRGNYTGFYEIPFLIDEDLVNRFDTENPNALAYVYNSLLNNSQALNAAYNADAYITYNNLLLAYNTLSMNFSATLDTFSQEIGTVNGDDYATVKDATIILAKAMFSPIVQVPGVGAVIQYDNTYNDLDENDTTDYGRSYIGVAKSIGIDYYESDNMYPDDLITEKQVAYAIMKLNRVYGSYPTRNVTRTGSTKTANRLSILPSSPLVNNYRMIIENDLMYPLYNLNWTDGTFASPLVSYGHTLFYYQQIISCLQNYAVFIKEFYDVDVTFSFNPVFAAFSEGNFKVRVRVQIGESSSPITLENLFGQDYSFDDGGVVKTYESTNIPWLDKINEFKTSNPTKYNNYYKYAEVLTDTTFLMTADGSTDQPADVSDQSMYLELALFSITAIATQAS